ncbi:gas vesicle protein GvpG [Roseibacterium sp. SDUM158017]|uniref:gas vesicle protein GvpG n=1 Tax=Roseicyclus salinarum TaxID=3036773 RepID=UPI00241531B6|nr:gas vesicle protein GvpG [Roseibacterium sp. SDUM158017]MDG4648420.1 gas vesicle protein GvpG [Roseibacterium sp. SDUM158017]
MGLLRKILTLPVSAPADGVVWLAARIAEAAEAERNDPSLLREALVDAEAKLLSGELGEDEYDAIETDLLLRLRAIPE